MSSRRRKLLLNDSTSIYDSESSTYYKSSLTKEKDCKKKQYEEQRCYTDHKIRVEDNCSKKYKERETKIVEERQICMTESNFRSRREKCIEALTVDSYSVDTDLLRWKPRMLVVPSEEYKTLDAAICALKPRSGGYVIKLNPRPDGRDHVLTKEVCDGVDYLSIIGDTNPFAGVSFIQRCSTTVETTNGITTMPPVNNPVYLPCNNCSNYSDTSCSDCTAYEDELLENTCKYHERKRRGCNNCNIPEKAIYGKGPFDIDIEDNILTVSSIRRSGANDPDFSCIPEGTRIMFITDRIDTTPIIGTIMRASGNTLMIAELNRSTAIPRTNHANGSSTLIPGTGIAILPNVGITVQGRNFNLSAQERLYIKGVAINAISPLFYVNSPGGVVELANCYIVNTICYRGRYLLKSPNLYTGSVVLWPGSIGEAYCQTFYGVYAHLQAITCTALWDACYFVFNVHGFEALHGAKVDLSNSYFISCCMAASATLHSTIGLTGTIFCHNTYAVILTYLSTAGGVVAQIPGLRESQVTGGPWFVNNTVMIVAYYNSYAILPLTGGVGNLIPFVIDSKVYTTLESNPIGNINQLQSMVIITRNPFAPDPSTLGCSGILSENLNRIDSWGITSMSAVTQMINLQQFVMGINADATIQNIGQIVENNGNDNQSWGSSNALVSGTNNRQ